MEAKNLYEHNFRKSDNSSMTNALSVQKRYIETGINHIVSGYYPPETMMVGYVLEGGIAPIVSAINSILGDSSSRLVATPHKLTVAKGQELYSSRHESLDIRHLLLQF